MGASMHLVHVMPCFDYVIDLTFDIMAATRYT